MRPSPPSVTRPPRERAAFTLVELLVVIVIIAVLVALLLPVTGMVRSRMDSTQCVSNLRQIGVAINAYINDHNGTLPGPLTSTQGPTYVVGQAGSLAAFLDPYLGQSSSNSASSHDPNLGQANSAGANRYSPVFECPAAARLLHDPTRPTYLMDDAVPEGATQSIWGAPGLNQQPMIATAILKWMFYDDDGTPLQLSQMWLMQDGDQNYVTSHQIGFDSTANIGGLLPMPAHVTFYNALFFDFHVEARVPSLSISN
jgi:prepilin-type N-terminal cleavage/methylation domain-containing protein